MEILTIAIKNLRPEAEFSYNDNDYSTIKWDILEGDAPTKKEIDEEIARIQNEELAKAGQKQALLDRLGITADEARLLLL